MHYYWQKKSYFLINVHIYEDDKMLDQLLLNIFWHYSLPKKIKSDTNEENKNIYLYVLLNLHKKLSLFQFLLCYLIINLEAQYKYWDIVR